MNKKLWFFMNGGSFTPLSLSPFAYWDNGSTYMAADGTSWTDRIGGRNLSGGTSTFTAGALNGRPSLTFNGAQNLTAGRITNIQGIGAITMWNVGKRSVMGQGNSSTGWTNRTGLFHYSDDTVYAPISDGTLKYGSKTLTNTFHYLLMVFDGSQTGNANRLRIWIDGVAQTLTFSGTIPAATETDVTSVFDIGKVPQLVAGQTCEAGIITRAITAGEITSLNSFLASRYAL